MKKKIIHYHNILFFYLFIKNTNAGFKFQVRHFNKNKRKF